MAEEMRAIRDAAYGYGRNLGIAFQLVDDLLDFNPHRPLLVNLPAVQIFDWGWLRTVLYAWQELRP